MPLSVCIPTYRGTELIEATLATVFAQDYTDFEVVVCNDSPADHAAMAAKIAAYRDPRLRFFTNDVNLGYPLNLRKCVSLASHDVLFLLGQDDLLLGEDLFRRAMEVLDAHPEVGGITRPYYWFHDDPRVPIRATPRHPTRIIDIRSDLEGFAAILETVGQLSALVYRRHLITEPFNENVFPAHIYPFLSILKTHKCYYWPDYNLAVRTLSSQTRSLSSIYRPSPTLTWVEMFQRVFREPEFAAIRREGIRRICRNHVGLAQIRNYGRMPDFFADAWWLARSRPRNAVNPRYWAYVLGLALTPRPVLRRLVDGYKRRHLSRRLRGLLNGVPDIAGRGLPTVHLRTPDGRGVPTANLLKK